MPISREVCEGLVTGLGDNNLDDDRGEHALLTGICLHLINATKLEDEIADKDAVFFAEHFVFHNISRQDLRAVIKNVDSSADLERLLDLIDEKIRKPAYGIYCDMLADKIFSDDQQKKFLCNVLLELLTKETTAKKHPANFGSWDNFTAACKTYDIDLGPLLKKDIIDALKTDTDIYLKLLETEQKTLSSAASQKAIGDKITVLQNLQNILANPKLDEKNAALVTFIQDKNNIPTLNQRRYVSRGLRHAGEVFIKSLLLFAALIVDIATLAAIKLITGTSLTARAHARFFPVKGEKLTESLIQHCPALLKA